MTFSLGSSSIDHLHGVHPKLSECVQLAITLTTQDFTVYEGLRTVARQVILVHQGFSKTMDSQHIPQADGFGHAVDLVPWIQGHPVWDWDGCYKVAQAMDVAATRLGIAQHIRWGGAWDKRLSDFGGEELAYKAATQAYQHRHVGPDFLDGPHFEWRA
jgi:peptidoglycan L-alanyl-D-glutamate endopeptidase CwlK